MTAGLSGFVLGRRGCEEIYRFSEDEPNRLSRETSCGEGDLGSPVFLSMIFGCGTEEGCRVVTAPLVPDGYGVLLAQAEQPGDARPLTLEDKPTAGRLFSLAPPSMRDLRRALAGGCPVFHPHGSDTDGGVVPPPRHEDRPPLNPPMIGD